jgi:ubiquinol-cytochrome c reductase cytochrome b subunit
MRYTLMVRNTPKPLEAGPETDADGIPAPGRGLNKVRARMSHFWYADDIPKPTAEEYEELTSGHGHH